MKGEDWQSVTYDVVKYLHGKGIKKIQINYFPI